MDTTELADLNYCVIDTETTGGKAAFNRIIDVAVFRVHQGVVVDKFEALVNPGRPIPPWITGLTGITDDMVRHAPSFEEISEDLKHFFTGGVFTAHNAPFDFGFISEEYRRLGQVFDMPRFCTLKLSRKLFSDLSSKSLGSVCDHLLIDIWDRHRARGDAEATVAVLKSILDVLKRHHQVLTWGDLERFITTPVLSKGLDQEPLSSPAKISHRRSVNR